MTTPVARYDALILLRREWERLGISLSSAIVSATYQGNFRLEFPSVPSDGIESPPLLLLSAMSVANVSGTTKSRFGDAAFSVLHT